MAAQLQLGLLIAAGLFIGLGLLIHRGPLPARWFIVARTYVFGRLLFDRRGRQRFNLDLRHIVAATVSDDYFPE